MNTLLSLTTARGSDGAPVLRAAGEIDRSNSAELAAALEEGLEGCREGGREGGLGGGSEGGREPEAGRLTVDLSGVSYLDSAGLSVLFEHADRIELVVPRLLAPVVAVSGLGELTEVREAAERPSPR
jgi:anti-anti-sigma regulatory factor